MAKLITQSCGELNLAVSFSRGERAIYRPPDQQWTSDKPQKQATAKVVWSSSYLAVLLVNVSSYCLMEKMCLTVVCVDTSFLNPIT